MSERGNDGQHGKPRRCASVKHNWNSVRRAYGPFGVAERLVVVKKPGNAGGELLFLTIIQTYRNEIDQIIPKRNPPVSQ
jgi:hypothetical protein